MTSLKKLYFALVHPHILYSIEVYDKAAEYVTDKLYKLIIFISPYIAKYKFAHTNCWTLLAIQYVADTIASWFANFDICS